MWSDKAQATHHLRREIPFLRISYLGGVNPWKVQACRTTFRTYELAFDFARVSALNPRSSFYGASIGGTFS
jgi:hypothetical protein